MDTTRRNFFKGAVAAAAAVSLPAVGATERFLVSHYGVPGDPKPLPPGDYYVTVESVQRAVQGRWVVTFNQNDHLSKWCLVL